jgi:hypothetical protein
LDFSIRSVTAGGLLVFAGLIGLGAVGFLPLALEQVGASGAPRGMPWMRADKPSLGAGAETMSATPRVSEQAVRASESEQASRKPEEVTQEQLTFEKRIETTKEEANAVKSAFAQQPEAQQPENVRPEMPPPPKASAEEQVPPVPPAARLETVPSIPEKTVAAPPKRTPVRAERHVPKHKQTANNNAEKRTREARRAVRRFDDTLRDIPVSAYAPDRGPRTIVIHPTSIQDYYYYSSRR